MQYLEQVIKGELRPVSDADYLMQAKAATMLARLPEGAIVRREITRVFPGRTHAQLGAIFGLCMRMILDDFEDRGVDLATFLKNENIPPGLPVTIPVLKEYLYAVCGDVGPNKEHKRLSTPMNTQEASVFFDNIRRHAASAWHVVIPDPQPRWLREAIA